MSLEVLRAFEHTLAREIPGFKVCFKDESKLMGALGFLMQPFNPTFLTHYTTTFWSNVYFCSRAEYERDPDFSLVTLAHEFVHIHDSRLAGFRFQLSYAMPQALALPVLLAYAILGSTIPLAAFLLGYCTMVWVTKGAGAEPGRERLAFWVPLGAVGLGCLGISIAATGWWALLLLVGLVCLGPWSSAPRTHWELRGYTMNLAVYVWLRNTLPPEDVMKFFAAQFTGPAYWFMCRDVKKIEDAFALALRSILERQLQREMPYSVVHRFLVEQGRAAAAFSD